MKNQVLTLQIYIYIIENNSANTYKYISDKWK